MVKDVLVLDARKNFPSGQTISVHGKEICVHALEVNSSTSCILSMELFVAAPGKIVLTPFEFSAKAMI
jgi:hypothetical protein